VHCVCHRLALVLTDGIKGSTTCDQVIPDVCVIVLNDLYGYFARSPRRKKALKDYLATENAENIERRRRLEAEGRRVPSAHNEVNPVDALEDVLTVLLERLKLPRRIVMTRWLSTVDAVRVVLNARDVYINFFYSEENDKASAILDLLIRGQCRHGMVRVSAGRPACVNKLECIVPVHTPITAYTICTNKSNKGEANSHGWRGRHTQCTY
jgi:hypothetical protein